MEIKDNEFLKLKLYDFFLISSLLSFFLYFFFSFSFFLFFSLPSHRPRGDVFSVPFQNLQIREEKVQVGDIVSFSYDSFSRRSIPINVKIFRIRKDLEWEQVIESYRKDSTSKLNSILKNKI